MSGSALGMELGFFLRIRWVSSNMVCSGFLPGMVNGENIHKLGLEKLAMSSVIAYGLGRT